MARRNPKTKALTAKVRSVSTIDRDAGIRIRAIRIEQGVSQQDLGEALGVSFQQVQKYEKGTNRLSLGRAVEIARVLKTTPHDLMGWTDGKLNADGHSFDLEAYKLSLTLKRLPDPLKPALRSFVNTLITATKDD